MSSLFESPKDFKKIAALLPYLPETKPEAKLESKADNKALNFILNQYLKYYNLPSYNNYYNKEISLTIGKLKVSEFDVVTQIYSLNNNNNNKNYKNKGLMVFIHGYLDHFGLYADYINFLLINGYTVIGIDLPGHGLSTGKIGDIVDFGQYAQTIEVLVKFIKKNYPQDQEGNNLFNYYISAFSAGCSITIEYLLRNRKDNLFNKAFFYAPLLRVPLWGYNRIACYAVPFVKFISREPKKISHDPVFLNFVKNNDPLQPKFLPLRWVKAMHDWADRLAKYKPIDLPVLIIQGTEDKTINWQYNIPKLAETFPNHQVFYVYGAYHNLCNESKEYQEVIFDRINSFINY